MNQTRRPCVRCARPARSSKRERPPLAERRAARGSWVDDANAALFTDLYQLRMLRAYHAAGMHGTAVFDLFARRLPSERNYLVACGLADALHFLETAQFTPESVDYLASMGEFDDDFLQWIADWRFTGDVWAMPEGTPVFADEPILEVVAPIGEAQLVETFLLNQVHFQTLVASKAARVVEAAQGRGVVDFGMRRMHGADAAMRAARAYHVAGVGATSNVLAGKLLDIPIAGTVAHSFIEACEDEAVAFRRFASLYPETVLLVDTYDTLGGVQNVIRLAAELGDDFRVRGIRLDSGDLARLARDSRKLLDEAGLADVQVFASGSLDEYAIAKLVAAKAPIDAFGVGTKMGVSADAPYLDSAFKLVGYEGEGRMKLSSHKMSLPRRKQVYRRFEGGVMAGDTIGLYEEQLKGEPLLRQVMQRGETVPGAVASLDDAREHCTTQRERLPERLRRLEPADPPYRVELSAQLKAERDRLAQYLQAHAQAWRQ